jgi:hypothetical protein
VSSWNAVVRTYADLCAQSFPELTRAEKGSCSHDNDVDHHKG